MRNVRILRVFNNNVVLARDPYGREVILTGRGVGFGRKAGDEAEDQRIQQTFVPDAQHDQDQLTAFLTEIPPEHLQLAADVLDLARRQLGVSFTQGMVIPLADHINFAVRRARQGMAMEYVLQAEVAHLYPRELAAAREAVALIVARTGVVIPADEAVPIALHFVNAQFATDDLSRTFQMTEVFRQIFGVLESAYGRSFDTSSMSAARFITHLRFFFVRVEAGKQLQEHPPVFARAP